MLKLVPANKSSNDNKVHLTNVTGLAWTPSGGDILFVEACLMPGTGELVLTGQLGN